MAFLSNPSPIVALSCQSLHCVSHSSLWICWFCWIRATSPKVTQPLILLSIIKSCLILGDDWVGGSQFLLLCDLYPPKKKHIHRQKFSTKKRRNRAQLFLTFILQFIFFNEKFYSFYLPPPQSQHIVVWLLHCSATCIVFLESSVNGQLQDWKMMHAPKDGGRLRTQVASSMAICPGLA